MKDLWRLNIAAEIEAHFSNVFCKENVLLCSEAFVEIPLIVKEVLILVSS